ncbi:N-acetylmuramoyl-L-alanine amidase [Halorussus caseinilyticus]|uniref:N-acetylmuramoyl-L-alanine amidase n=1 Tax=Halorussus caseinilyticus TaxID=3034025 RepID=UPI0023E8BE24|nr:N-acetylmuramoyl-L-alanine amidase [Halorussus sp. DT72]
MVQSRRRFLKLAGSTAATGALIGASNSASAYSSQPNMRWEPADPSNYTEASRSPSEMRWIIIHVTEGSYEGTISWFKDPDANVSTHYVIENDSNAEITKMLNRGDIGWHAGNGGYNDTSLGFEHEGYTDQTTFTDALYRSSAKVVRYLADKCNIPLTRPSGVAPCNPYDGIGGIIGHHQVPDPNDCGYNSHTDPGSTWDWGTYMNYVQGTTLGARFSIGEGVVTTASVNVRSEPAIGDNVVHTNPVGEVGYVQDGYVTEDGYTWWKIEYNNGVTGWSVDRFHASDAI